ncbi:MAG TPA: FAD-binding oxidoreductase [Polyangia bacterium]|nr:FAD-binding oxidoreductase [Polyangia bacterium]
MRGGRPRIDARAAADRHARKLEQIADQVRGFARARRPVSFRKAAVSHQVPKLRDTTRADDKIDLTGLTEILELVPERRICVAEAGVTFDQLVDATLPHGLMPTVVPELRTITVGGAVAGCSIESGSFLYGGFHDSCVRYEVVTARGDVLEVSPDDADPDDRLLFQMLHGTFGTLGVLSALTFRLVPARPFVKLVYEKYRTVDELQAAIRRHFDRRDVDFMDGFAHGPDCYVLNAGTFVDAAPYTSRYDWLKVYCQSTRARAEDYLRTKDYFFRYDRGVTNVHPRSMLGRLLLGKFVGSSEILRLAQRFPWLLPSKPEVTIDLFLPFSRVEPFLRWFDGEFQFYPLWCVPYRRVRDYEWLAPSFYAGLADDLFLDIAVYGRKQREGRNDYRVIEEKLLEMGGLKTLISHNHFTEQEFWSVWNRANFDRVKARTDPDNLFRDLYEKTLAAGAPARQPPAPAPPDAPRAPERSAPPVDLAHP